MGVAIIEPSHHAMPTSGSIPTFKSFTIFQVVTRFLLQEAKGSGTIVNGGSVTVSGGAANEGYGGSLDISSGGSKQGSFRNKEGGDRSFHHRWFAYLVF
jgi:hypothetical protein